MLKIFFIILFANLLLGILATFISGEKYPILQKKKNKSKQKENSPDEIPNFEDNNEEEKEVNAKPIHHSPDERDDDLIIEMAKKLIPTESQAKNPKIEAAKDMGDHIKDYVDTHPEQATKVFKHWMRSNSKE